MTRQGDPDAPAASSLLEWYDRHARALPWRVPPTSKRRADPYRVWLSEIMLQQTTVVTVKPYFEKFVATWPTVNALAEAPLDDVLAAWAGLGYYARARNMYKCARAVVEAHGGAFPSDEAGLRALPGVGPYTAAAVAAIAFDRPAVVVDGNVERVMSRIFNIETPLPAAKPALAAAAATLTPKSRPGDYAQAVMDLGATICTPRNPACGICPWSAACAARLAGSAEALPKKTPQPPKPIRLGLAYLALDNRGRVLLRRRPESGLLGGMWGLPSTDWCIDGPDAAAIAAAAPTSAAWRRAGIEARHTFTHFHLRLEIAVARVGGDVPAGTSEAWTPRTAFGQKALPTLMRKALTLGLGVLDASP